MNEHNLPLLLLATTPKCIYCPPIVNHIWPRLQTKLAGLVIFEHVEVVNYGDPHPYKLDKFIRWYPSFILCDGNIINEYSDRCIVFGGVEINGNVQLARPSKPFTIENIYNWVVDALKNHEFFVSIKDIKLNVEPFDGLDNAIKVALKIQSLLTDYEKVILKYESVLSDNDKRDVINIQRELRRLNEQTKSSNLYVYEFNICINRISLTLKGLLTRYDRLDKAVNTIKDEYISRYYSPPTGKGYIKSQKSFGSMI